MTKKDMMELVTKKYQLIAEDLTKELVEKREEMRDKRSKAKKKIIEEAKWEIANRLYETGYYKSVEDLAENMNIHSYDHRSYDKCELTIEIDRICLEVAKERDQFIETIMILGMKNDNVRQMLMDLCEKTRG